MGSEDTKNLHMDTFLKRKKRNLAKVVVAHVSVTILSHPVLTVPLCRLNLISFTITLHPSLHYFPVLSVFLFTARDTSGR